MVASSGIWRGEKVALRAGKQGCCIWLGEDGATAFCLDFPADSLDDLIEVLRQMKASEARALSDEEEVQLTDSLVLLEESDGRDSDS